MASTMRWPGLTVLFDPQLSQNLILESARSVAAAATAAVNEAMVQASAVSPAAKQEIINAARAHAAAASKVCKPIL